MKSRPPVRTAFQTLCLTTAALALASCGEMTPVDTTRARRVCRPAPGPTPTQCRLLGNDASWLPPAYVRNASCMCQTTPSSPTANCVRGKLDETIRSVPETTRDEWRRKKVELHDAGKADEYDRWLRAEAAREIYRWHERAHAQCCCTAPLPTYESWSSTVTVPFDTCTAARSLSRFGTCRGIPGRW